MSQLLKNTIAEYNEPELAKVEGMVYQVWEDGEVTLQKCGSLLNRRNLHMIVPGKVEKAVSPDFFPEQTNGHGFMYTSREGADAVRIALGLNPDY